MKARKEVLFCKKEPKNFCHSGSGALAASAPMRQIKKVFLLLFVHKKKSFACLNWA
jgi:hypothetical protein